MSAPAARAPLTLEAARQPITIGGLVTMLSPLLLVALCFANKFGLVTLPAGARVILIFVLLIAMMTTGMPISIALGLTVLIFIFTMTEVPIDAVALKLFTGLEKFEIMAIPFFILAGTFLTHGGVAKRMINFAVSLIGHWHGGLALAGIMACAMFSLVCGSSVATVVAIGSIILPEMVRQGYPVQFGAAIITVAGSLGILMLPSIAKVIYAISTGTSIGALFVAGLLPGLLLTVMLCGLTWYIAKRNGYPRTMPMAGRSSFRATMSALTGFLVCLPAVLIVPITVAGLAWEDFAPVARQAAEWLLVGQAVWLVVGNIIYRLGFNLGLRYEGLKVWRAYWDSIWGLMLVVVLVGGIIAGVFTATEAAAMSAVYSFFVAVFVYRDMGLKDVPGVLLRSANMSAMLLYIITNAVLFSFVLANENIPNELAAWMLTLQLGPWGFLLLVNLMLLIAGNFMEPTSIILVMAPILFPTAVQLGINPVHFGILIDVNMEVGLCHPPVGLNLYVASGISKLGITELTKAVLPWLALMLFFLAIVTYWPWLTLVVPKALGLM